MKTGIMIVGGGILQIPALIKAKDMGLTTHLTDRMVNCAAKKYADYFYRVDTKDVEANSKLAVELRKANKIQGVYTQGTDVEYTVASAAQKAKLPGIDPEVALNCNDKYKMRILLRKHGIENMHFYKARTFGEFKRAVGIIGFPCYVKPLNNSASRGVTRLTNGKNLVSAFKVATENSFSAQGILVESEIAGNEYSVDTILFNGKLYPAGISDRVFLKKNKYAIQVGSRTPSQLPEKTQANIYELMNRAAKALGVTNGAFKGDIVVDKKNKIRIIEVTARTSGGFDSQFRKPLSFGVDLIKATLDIALGKPLDPLDLIPKWVKWSSTISVMAGPGRVKKIAGVNKIKRSKGVHRVFMLVKKGDLIKPYFNCADRTNYVICHADTLEKLINIENMVHKNLIIKVS